MAKPGMEHLYSKSACCAVPSAIREINKLVDSPGMKSLAGGWPDPAVFRNNFVQHTLYEVIRNSVLWFFSNLKAANEELETLFIKSFDLSLIRVIPYTAAHLGSGLTDTEKDILLKLSPTNFAE